MQKRISNETDQVLKMDNTKQLEQEAILNMGNEVYGR
jgi:hypothetical protein